MTWKDLPRNPSAATLRQFAGLWLIFFGVLGLFRWRNEETAWALALWAVAAAGGLAGLVRPVLLRPIFVGWLVAVFPIGWLVSHLLLGAIFYLLFTPLGILRRLLGNDPLHLRKETCDTYWLPKPAAPGPASYYRQF